MDVEIIQSVSTIAFLAVIGLFAVISLLAAYVFIRYGRSKSITTVTSLAFAVVFLLGTMAAYLNLQSIF